MKTLTFGALVTVTCLSLAMAGCGDDEGGTESGSGASGATGGTGGAGGTGGTGGTGGAGGTGGTGGSGAAGGAGGGVAMPMTLTSPSYMDGGMIPVQHSCNGANISPALNWTPGPAGTMSYAIVFRDLDNSMLGHSAIWDIPAATTSLPEDVDKSFMPADVPGRCSVRPGTTSRVMRGRAPTVRTRTSSRSTRWTWPASGSTRAPRASTTWTPPPSRPRSSRRP